MRTCGQSSISNINVVWANNGDKVTRDELRASSNPTSVINSVWTGNRVTLFGAKNEVVAFNLILEAQGTAANNVTLSFDTLTGPGGATIASVPATGDGVFNWVGRNIELFYVRYLEIKGLSTDLFYNNYDERHIPERFRRPWTGDGEGSGTWQDRPDHNKFYPDIAIPLELVSSFDIAVNQNQSIWVDIFIPKNAEAGLYTGTITIQENDSTSYQVPVELSVRNFTLPDLPNVKTMLYHSMENINDRYLGVAEPEEGTGLYTQSLELADRHFQIAHRHKISLIGDDTEIEDMGEAWTSRLSGDLFTAVQGYDGPGIGVGNNIYSIGTYGSWSWQDGTQSDMWTNTDAWVNWFDAQAFITPTDYFLYLIDESDDYPQIEQWSQWINNNPGPGKNLMSMATMALPIAAVNTPSLDIPTSWFQVGITNTWQNAADSYEANSDKRLYMYNSNRPGSGTFATEDDGVALRELAWGHYKKGIDRWLYWESTYYNNFQGNTGQTNVFQKAHTFGDFDSIDSVLGETGWNYLNGDGVLLYPGTDTQYPSDSYGVMGPLASLRLKHWRRGIQDVDYLTIAASINPTRTAEIVNTIIPKVLWEYGVGDPNDPTWVLTDISWSTDPDVWEAARAELADIITSTTAPSITITFPNHGSTVSGTVEIQASAWAGNGVDRVEFFIDGVLKGTDTTSPYTYSWDTTSYSEDSHTLTARVYDTENETAEDQITVVIQRHYTLTISSSSGGTTDPSPGPYTHETGATVTINAIAYSGYTFSNWTGDVSSTSNPITITMDSNKSIQANFTATSTGEGEGDDEGDGDGDGCFIATVCYGTPMTEEVKILRAFRDKYLLTNQAGEALVRLYYRYSPSVAEFISERESLKEIIRVCLKPIVWFIDLVIN